MVGGITGSELKTPLKPSKAQGRVNKGAVAIEDMDVLPQVASAQLSIHTVTTHISSTVIYCMMLTGRPETINYGNLLKIGVNNT